MATLLEQANLAENEEFLKRVSRAVSYHANYFLSTTDPLVVAKVRWCKDALQNSKVRAMEILSQVTSDPAIAGNLDKATDRQIQGAVDAAIPIFAARIL